jgi:hypothetical protein
MQSSRSLSEIASPMDCLDIVRVVVSPGPSHPFGLDVCDLKHIFAVRQGYGLDRSDCLAASVSRRAKCFESALLFPLLVLQSRQLYGLRLPPGSPVIDVK